MRYSESRKEETRKKVVQAAAAAVRAKGPDGVGVAEIMAEAGLTHGGFYAHFKSKEALVAAAIEEAFGQSRRRFARMTEDMSSEEALAAFVDAYVSLEHRNNPQRGCPISTLTNDLPRQGPMVRTAFDAGVAGLIARLEAWLPEPDPASRRSLASSLMAEMAGAVALSRAVSDVAMAGELLDASRARIKGRMGLVDGAAA
ncbi:TetR/AcrR family transcriptional regulator [Phenylobacterium sp.]|uniref:TetR/AcrR family transcriptional regulator n=1 Tax=Phenylobacterium sp. TaxID=1871053 RepID=UPI003564AD25